LTLGVRANVPPKSSIPIDAKVEMSPQRLYSRSQGITKKNPICNWEANLQPLGTNVSAFIYILMINVLAFISNLRLDNKQKMLKLGAQVFFDPDS
jgi:hypothetical protein